MGGIHYGKLNPSYWKNGAPTIFLGPQRNSASIHSHIFYLQLPCHLFTYCAAAVAIGVSSLAKDCWIRASLQPAVGSCDFRYIESWDGSVTSTRHQSTWQLLLDLPHSKAEQNAALRNLRCVHT
jgi:hypothetical protein